MRSPPAAAAPTLRRFGDHLLDGSRRDDVAARPDRLAVGLAQQVLLRREARGEREHVAREALGAAARERDRDGVHGLAPVRFLHGAAHDARALEVGVVGADGQHDRLDRGSLLAQRRGVRRRLVRSPEHDRVVADPDPVRGRQACSAAAEEDAGHLVAGEHDVLLERTRRDHDRARVHHVEQARADHRHLEPLVDADRRVRWRELDQRLAAGLGDQARDGLLDGARRQLPAGLVLVDREHALAGSRGAERRRQPGRAEADHEHVGMQMRALEVARHVRQVDPAAAGDLADDRLDLRPRPLRLDQRLVVEARRERPVHAVVDRERVALDARPGSLALRRHAVARGAQARANVALAVDLEQAVGAVAGQAVEPSPAVVLEAARERAHARAEDRRCDAVARAYLDRGSFEVEAHGSTMFVRVLRVIVSQRRQPSRWNQRSRWSPHTFRRIQRRRASTSGALVGVGGRPYLAAVAEVGRRSRTAVRTLDDEAHRRSVSCTSGARPAARHPTGAPSVQECAKWTHAAGRSVRADHVPGIQLVPASGTFAIAAASSVRATRSSGSMLWTCDLPQARARVWHSSVITRR